jgi:hypothetical protein
MASSQRKAIVIARADDLLSELRIREPSEIDIERIAFFKDARVRYALLRGMDGCLVRKDDRAVITVRSSLRYEGQKRFVIAHELGHFFLHPSTRQIETVDQRQTTDWSQRQESEEYEANLFGAELLMPRRFVQSRIAGQEPSFNLIKLLANEFRTTLTATAVQFVLSTSEECVLVSCNNRHRAWFIPSKGFSFSLLEDDYVHGHSCAAEVNEARRCSRSSDVQAGFWLEGYRGDDKSSITEDAIYFPALQRTLSLLWIHEAI